MTRPTAERRRVAGGGEDEHEHHQHHVVEVELRTNAADPGQEVRSLHLSVERIGSTQPRLLKEPVRSDYCQAKCRRGEGQAPHPERWAVRSQP